MITRLRTIDGAVLRPLNGEASAALADREGRPASEVVTGTAYIAFRLNGTPSVIFDPHEMGDGHTGSLTANRTGEFWVTLYLDGEPFCRASDGLMLISGSSLTVKWDYEAMA